MPGDPRDPPRAAPWGGWVADLEFPAPVSSLPAQLVETGQAVSRATSLPASRNAPTEVVALPGRRAPGPVSDTLDVAEEAAGADRLRHHPVPGPCQHRQVARPLEQAGPDPVGEAVGEERRPAGLGAGE